MNKYILDTDIGDDIDDAFALDLALRSELDLIGVTTVFRNTVARAAIAKKLISVYGKNIPVYAGLGKTLDGEDMQHLPLCQTSPDCSGPAYAPDNARPEEAVDFLIAMAKKYGSDLTLIAIGPLTNVAAAIRKDPEAMKKPALLMMGGDYVSHNAEWNIHCDVTAAKTVFSSGIRITAFGFDVTRYTAVEAPLQDYIFSMGGDARKDYLSLLSRLWYRSKWEGCKLTLHDVLVVLYALDPTIAKPEKLRVAVEEEGRYTRGMTVVLSDMILNPRAVEYRGEVSVARDVDFTRFMQTFENEIGYMPKGGIINEENENDGDRLSGSTHGGRYDGLY